MDPEDDTIYYHTPEAKKASLQLRTLNCMIPSCNSVRSQFPNVASLQRHLETQHEKTFCKICLNGRTIFIREQRLYHIKSLRLHLEEGDLGDHHHGEILPHPFCDFCDEFFYNDLVFFDHLHKKHLTCHLCTTHHKNVYYSEYANLERHFTKSHFICPLEECKEKCYVAFKSEDELKAHLDITHNFASQQKQGKKVNANVLLGFKQAERDAEDHEGDADQRGRGKGGKDRKV